MDVYEVGGSVRDALLGLPAADRDWVVVGSSAQALQALGYRQVGKDFPVFLHPETSEEYALARTERKVGPGHRGFAIDAAETVTLEQDLSRRDLTINAIARDPAGNLIDPYGGCQDIEARRLKHVSPAFREDPLRVLRVARFAARFASLGFSVADETLALMREISASGELDALQAERVWSETERALAAETPAVYFEVLRACGALAIVFPEVERLFGVPQPARWHPEIDTGVHTLLALTQSAALSDDPRVRFAVLVHDLGKGTTPAEMLPRHHGHEARSVGLIRALSKRVRVPKPFEALALKVAEHHGRMHRIHEMRPSNVHDLLAALGALRQPDTLEPFLLACEADAKGRTGLENEPYEPAPYLKALLEAALTVGSDAVPAGTVQGAAFGAALRDLRIDAIRERQRQLNDSATA